MPTSSSVNSESCSLSMALPSSLVLDRVMSFFLLPLLFLAIKKSKFKKSEEKNLILKLNCAKERVGEREKETKGLFFPVFS